MNNLSRRSIIIFTLLLMTEIYQIAAQTIDERPLNARKQTTKTCPLLVRPNNWEIEKSFGSWYGMEMFVHSENNNSMTFEDSCFNIRVVEVNELNEEMTYGKTFDPFNFRLALRHLKIEFIKNNNVTKYFATFNNTNQMLWRGNNIVIQIIKFDEFRDKIDNKDDDFMLMTVCEKDKGELYTISANRTYDSKKADFSSKNDIYFRARNLKIFSQHNLQFDCTEEPVRVNSSGHKFNSDVMLIYFVMFFVARHFLL
ncbi:hypothetical protein PVAND_009557 [Polypedilum vanderplanki]|uniref:Uncharacterized protein n=1 Tax=Polypedilum vanderplanki TaxID=319348 RepID=A0A9J6CDY0_POLVA|nr:hypothetical protein PVAND_009557 [Polypedilum vanderplanki]